MIHSLASGREPRARLPRFAALIILLGLVACGSTSHEGQEPAIPPGREELLSAMLGAGAALPGDCKFTGGGVKHSVVEAKYTCSGAEISLELAHPSRASDSSGAVVTEKFAMVPKQGAPPPELIKALADSVREREAEFEWLWLSGNAASSDSPSSIPVPALAVGALVVLGVAGWMLRRRKT